MRARRGPLLARLRGALLAFLLASGLASSVARADWPQLQHDAARTGYTPDSVPPPYRARWIWLGSEGVLRNRASRPGDGRWTSDLAPGTDFPMPRSVGFSFAGSMQPVTCAGRVFVADCQGAVHALRLDDGETLWRADLPGGSLGSGVASDRVVVFASTPGWLRAFDAKDGRPLWSLDTGRAITSAPALAGGVVYAASQSGRVWAVGLDDGVVRWRSDFLGAPIQGGLCVAGGSVYTGTEAMDAVALDASSGRVVARRRLLGQGFRRTWPVAAGDRILFTTVPLICVGSEYVNDGVLAGRPGTQPGWVKDARSGHPDLRAENEAMTRWIAGEGRWWETCWSLRAGTLEKDGIVATGATEGCGTPPDPPCLDAEGRPLVWWATAFPTLTRVGTFGSSYSMDLGSFDPITGRRAPIDRGRLSGQTTETDNLYGLAVGGRFVYLRQDFRGTFAIDLDTARGSFISAVYGVRDGGRWPADVVYFRDERGSARAPSAPRSPAGRVAPAIDGDLLVFCETFCVTCIESAAAGGGTKRAAPDGASGAPGAGAGPGAPDAGAVAAAGRAPDEGGASRDGAHPVAARVLDPGSPSIAGDAPAAKAGPTDRGAPGGGAARGAARHPTAADAPDSGSPSIVGSTPAAAGGPAAAEAPGPASNRSGASPSASSQSPSDAVVRLDRCLWEAPRARDVDPTATEWMVVELRAEIDRILAAPPPLAPLRCAHADLPHEAWWLYGEPGRIIATLAAAAPHLDPARLGAVRAHVRELLDRELDAPWTPGLKRPDLGATRNLHGVAYSGGSYPRPESWPTLHALWGLWLWVDRAEGAALVRSHWAKVRARYEAGDASPSLFGGMSAHIAAARLAAAWDDSATVRLAVGRLAEDLDAAGDLARIEARARATRLGRFQEDRNRRSFPGQPFIFLDAPPEILRWMDGDPALRERALERVDAMESAYPLWWLAQSPYFTRWTGDEGVGLTSEVFGMLFPVERWIRKAPASALAGCLRSVPTGTGDAYWIEALVTAIEAHGTVSWERLPWAPAAEGTAPGAPAPSDPR